jgi:hypothetical protein
MKYSKVLESTHLVHAALGSRPQDSCHTSPPDAKYLDRRVAENTLSVVVRGILSCYVICREHVDETMTVPSTPEEWKQWLIVATRSGSTELCCCYWWKAHNHQESLPDLLYYYYNYYYYYYLGFFSIIVLVLSTSDKFTSCDLGGKLIPDYYHYLAKNTIKLYWLNVARTVICLNYRMFMFFPLIRTSI